MERLSSIKLKHTTGISLRDTMEFHLSTALGMLKVLWMLTMSCLKVVPKLGQLLTILHLIKLLK